jgi:hypothetical protein
MSEEVIEAVAAPAEEVQAKPAEKEDGGTDYIDFDSLDPKVKQRFDRIYKNMKDNERALGTSAQIQRQLVERLTNLEKSDINGKGRAAIEALESQKINALDEGDSASVIEIDKKIRAVEQSQNYTPTPINVPEPTTGGLSPQEEQAMEQWATEKSEDGASLRPWSDPGHPLHAKAASLGYVAMQDPNLFTLEEQLSEIDRLMGIETGDTVKRTSPGVLSTGEGGKRSSSKKAGLSQDERNIARVMYPEAKTAQDAEASYLKAKTGLGI